MDRRRLLGKEEQIKCDSKNLCLHLAKKVRVTRYLKELILKSESKHKSEQVARLFR